MFGGGIDERALVETVTEGALQESRPRVVTKSAEVPLDLAVLPMVIVRAGGEQTPHARQLVLDSLEHLGRVKDDLAVGVEPPHRVPSSLTDSNHLEDALGDLGLVLDLEDEVPVGKEVDGAEAHGAASVQVWRAQNEQVHGDDLGTRRDLGQVRVGAEVSVLASEAVGARILQLDEVAPLVGNVAAHLR